VQAKLDEIVEESQRHKARKQKNILLLSGGRRIDFYKNLEDYGGKDCLIPIKPNITDDLLAKHDRPDLLLFGTKDCRRGLGGSYSRIWLPTTSRSTPRKQTNDLLIYR